MSKRVMVIEADSWTWAVTLLGPVMSRRARSGSPGSTVTNAREVAFPVPEDAATTWSEYTSPAVVHSCVSRTKVARPPEEMGVADTGSVLTRRERLDMSMQGLTLTERERSGVPASM